MTSLDFALVGPGRLGFRIAHGLRSAGYRCRAVRGRRRPVLQDVNIVPGCRVFDTPEEPEPWPQVQLILVAVPDREIVSAATLLADRGVAPGTVVLHTSGLHTSELLEPCRRAGAHTGSWHPLQSFPAGDVSVPLQNVWCAIEGEAPAVDLAYRISRDLGMKPWTIAAENKALYHASAALAANVTHLLVASAGRLLGQIGVPQNLARQALEPLVTTSMGAALHSQGLEALTGPLARGDTKTLERHLEVLPPHLAEMYRHAILVAGSWDTTPRRASIDPHHGDV